MGVVGLVAGVGLLAIWIRELVVALNRPGGMRRVQCPLEEPWEVPRGRVAVWAAGWALAWWGVKSGVAGMVRGLVVGMVWSLVRPWRWGGVR